MLAVYQPILLFGVSNTSFSYVYLGHLTIVILWAFRNFVIIMTLWQVALSCTKRAVGGVHIGRSISSRNWRCFFFLIVILGGGGRDPPLLVPSRWSRASMPYTLSTLRVAKTLRWGVPLLSLPPPYSRPDPLVVPHSLNLESEPANGGEMHPKPVDHPLDPLAHLQPGQGFGLILYAHPAIVLNYVCLKNKWRIFENVTSNPYNISIFISPQESVF